MNPKGDNFQIFSFTLVVVELGSADRDRAA
jgi:hypothetical protein